MKKYLFAAVFAFIFFFTAEAFAFSLSQEVRNFLATEMGGNLLGQAVNALGFGETGFCWFCKIYEVLFVAMNDLATTIANDLKDIFIATLGVGLLFFIAFKVAATLVKLQEVDLMQFLGELFKHIGRAIIAIAFLFGAVDIYHYVVSPFLEYTFAFSLEILEAGGGTSTKIISTGVSVLDNAFASGACDDANMSLQLSAFDGKAFSGGLLNIMLCMLKNISASLIGGMIIGVVIMLLAGIDTVLGTIQNSQFLLTGLFVFGSYFMIFMAVPFKMIDAMVRLAFVAALTPLWIILWVFPQTAQYTKNAWEMFLNCCLTFICLSIMLVLVFHILDQMLPNSHDIFAVLIPDYTKLAASKMSLASGHMLLTGALGMLAVNMINASSQIATMIVKSYDAGVGAGLDSKMVAVAAASGGAVGALAGWTRDGFNLQAAQQQAGEMQKGIHEQFGNVWGFKPGENRSLADIIKQFREGEKGPK